ncbi:aldo/keto reductase [Streptomyces sp. L7]
MRLGDEMVNFYLVDHPEGLVLVDAGLPGHLGQLQDHLARSGRSLGDIRAVLLTHGHLDHTGLAGAVQQAGAGIWIHEADATILTDGPRSSMRLAKPERSMFPYLLRRPAAISGPLHLARMGGFTEKPVLGARTFSGDHHFDKVPGGPRAVEMPGHTQGTVAYHFPARRAVHRRRPGHPRGHDRPYRPVPGLPQLHSRRRRRPRLARPTVRTAASPCSCPATAPPSPTARGPPPTKPGKSGCTESPQSPQSPQPRPSPAVPVLAVRRRKARHDHRTSRGSPTPAADLTLSRMGYGAMQLAGPGVLRPAQGPPPGTGRTAQGGTAGHHPHRHQRLLRPLRRQRAHQGGPAPLPGRPAHRHQGRSPTRRDRRLDHRTATRRPHRPGPREPPAPRPRRPGRRQPAPPSFDGLNDDSIAERFGALADLCRQGLIRHLGLSGASDAQVTEAQTIAPVVTVQNLYNLANRQDDALVDRCAAENIAYAPYFPLGGFSSIQSRILSEVAARLDATPQQVALAWLLQRSATIVLIPGTSSLAHLRENIAAADLVLPADAVARLDTIGR